MRVDEEDLKQYKTNMRMSKSHPYQKLLTRPAGGAGKRQSVIISGQDVSMDLLSKQLEQTIQAYAPQVQRQFEQPDRDVPRGL